MPTERRGSRYVYEPSTLIVIDTDTNSIVKTVRFSTYLHVIAFNPVNNKLYATAHINGHVKVIDASSFAQTRIPVPGYPTWIAVNPDINRLYVALPEKKQVAVIDTASHTELGRLSVADVPTYLKVDGATGRVYVLWANHAPRSNRHRRA
jgi:DNA-binding beta-propeller fold protein YncE